jgi:hypothetical protein
MGVAWGIVSGKFAITAAGLLIAARIDQGRLQALVDPQVATSAVSRNFAVTRHLGAADAAQTLNRRPLTIGIGAEEFDQPNLAIAEPIPAPGADLLIGRDILSAHIFSLDTQHHELSLILKGDAGRLSRHFVAVPLSMTEDGRLRVTITINNVPSQATIGLNQTEPLDIGTSLWQSSLPKRGENAHIAIGGVRLNEIPWPDRIAPPGRLSLGLDAFGGRTLILDLPHNTLWVGPNQGL